MGYLFDRSGQVRKEFVRERGRKDLVEGSVLLSSATRTHVDEQFEAPVHFHGYSQRYVCAFHRYISLVILFLSLLRGQFPDRDDITGHLTR